MAAPKRIDYAQIEPAWRAGILSIDKLAAAYEKVNGVSVSKAALIQHFQGKGIPRDLNARITAQADAMVLQSEEDALTGKITIIPGKLDNEIVARNAISIATLRIEQRQDIQRFRKICISLLEELEAETNDIDSFLELGEILRREDDKGSDKLNDVYRKVISQSGRIGSMSTLANTMKTLIDLEKSAYGIKDTQDPQQNNTTNNIQINSDQIAIVIDQLQEKY